MSKKNNKIILLFALAILFGCLGCVRMNSPVTVMRKNNTEKFKVVTSLWRHKLRRSPWCISVYVDRVSNSEISWHIAIDDHNEDELSLFELGLASKRYNNNGPKDYAIPNLEINRPYQIKTQYGSNKLGPTYEVTIKDLNDPLVKPDIAGANGDNKQAN